LPASAASQGPHSAPGDRTRLAFACRTVRVRLRGGRSWSAASPSWPAGTRRLAFRGVRQCAFRYRGHLLAFTAPAVVVDAAHGDAISDLPLAAQSRSDDLPRHRRGAVRDRPSRPPGADRRQPAGGARARADLLAAIEAGRSRLVGELVRRAAGTRRLRPLLRQGRPLPAPLAPGVSLVEPAFDFEPACSLVSTAPTSEH
jgi:hypothetical protein